MTEKQDGGAIVIPCFYIKQNHIFVELNIRRRMYKVFVLFAKDMPASLLTRKHTNSSCFLS